MSDFQWTTPQLIIISKKAGGKFPQYNQILRPFLSWLMQNQVNLSLEWVPSQDQQADSLSRWGVDPGDYTLHPWVFQWVKHHFQPWATPLVDFFASPGNHQVPQFVSRWPHFQAIAVDALTTPWVLSPRFMPTPPGPSFLNGYTGCNKILTWFVFWWFPIGFPHHGGPY